MTDVKEVTAAELHTVMNAQHGCTDIGFDINSYRKAVADLRENKHIILVGPRMKCSDGKTSQYISFGQAESIKSKVDL